MFRKKKSEETPGSGEGVVREAVPSRLQELCNDNMELYQSLARILIVDPKRVTIPLESYLAEAQDDEAKGDKLRAELAYRIAGALALVKGDRDAVKKYFEKALSLAASPRQEYKVLSQHPGDAVDVARRYYDNAPV